MAASLAVPDAAHILFLGGQDLCHLHEVPYDAQQIGTSPVDYLHGEEKG